jgi:hypothetical protein
MSLSVRGVSWATVLTMLLITIMTVWSELDNAFKGMLVGMTGHHWVTKSVLSMVFFAVASVILGSAVKESDIKRTALYVSGFAVLFSAAIFVFYIYEFFAA